MNNDIFEIEEREETAPSTAASSNAGTYDDNAIQTLKWNEHIRSVPACISASSETEPTPTMAYMYLSKRLLTTHR